MRSIKIISILQGMFILLFIYSLFCTQTYFGTANYAMFGKIFPSFILISGIGIIIKDRYYLSFNKEDWSKLAILVMPYVVLLIYSFLMVFINPGLSLYNARTSSMNPLLYVMAGCIAFLYLGDKVIDLIWLSCMTNYTFYVLAFIRKYGITGVLHFISLTDNELTGQRPLEVHEVTFILGFLLVYYILKYGFSKKMQIITGSIYVILGYKRILLFGMIIVFILYFLLNDKRNKKRISFIISTALFMLCFGWIIISSSDLFLFLSNYLGIELNGREILMARVRQLYDFSLTYIGHGVGYTQNYMMDLVRNDPTANVNALHNDLLKYYIDLGCIPAIIFFINILILNTKRFAKFHIEYGFRYTLVFVLLMLCWMTDNLASYPNFLFVFNAMILSLVSENDRKIEST